MAQFVDPNELLFSTWEPKLANRFLMRIDGIPSYLIKKAQRPTIESSEIELPHINITRYTKGKTKWGGTAELELYDPITPSGAQIVMEEIRKSHESVTGRDSYGDFFMKDMTVEVLGPVGDVVESWTYKGAWIKSADFGGLDWAEEATPLMINLTIQYNYAILQF